MIDFLNEWYLWIRALHIIFVITWMAGLFYLPRLFVYHARVTPGSDQDEMFQVMEYKLLRVIMNPSIILVWVFGLALLFAPASGVFFDDTWIWVKLAAVVSLTGFHHLLGLWRKDFAAGNNRHGERFYRRINEVPSLLLVVIVVMVIVRPF